MPTVDTNVTATRYLAAFAAAVLLVVAAQARADIVFDSPWSTATGQSAEAVTDGWRWPIYAEYGGTTNGCGTQILDVVPGGPNGANTLRALSCTNDAAMIKKVDFAPQSTDFYLRFYYANDDTIYAGGVHYIECSDEEQCDTCINYMHSWADGSGNWTYSLSAAGHYYPNDAWHIPRDFPLQARAWYRFEFWVHFTAATTFQIWPRVYDASDTLLYDSDTFYCNDCAATADKSLTAFYDAGNTWSLAATDCLNDLMVGFNDPAGAPRTQRYFYVAGLQIRNDTWPGPMDGTPALAPSAPSRLQVN